MATFPMPAITALLHTCNDELRIGRALETLRPCDEVLIVDHGSRDGTLSVAREYGASIRVAGPGAVADPSASAARCPWVFCIRPSESISEALEASLYEWKLYDEKDVLDVVGAAMFVREERDGEWIEQAPELRLVRRTWGEWEGPLPRGRRCMLLQGDLLRFHRP